MQRNLIITLILSIIIAFFSILNAAPIAVNLVFTTVNLSAALVILISAFLGALIVYLLDTISKMKIKKQVKENEKTIVRMTNENQALTVQNNECNEELATLKEQMAVINSNMENNDVQEE